MECRQACGPTVQVGICFKICSFVVPLSRDACSAYVTVSQVLKPLVFDASGNVVQTADDVLHSLGMKVGCKVRFVQAPAETNAI